ncbi:hypothetical protein CCHOA_06660 [Corynebacterium choanae]|uniref:Uncharacterized protein n=1 Tax=Corynebacterium choanae TaxID=1862358 RepID=A0A3G6JC44_9CORY|nr:hypothetical protein CCHOA_06660 [Corynebacterium choanae]
MRRVDRMLGDVAQCGQWRDATNDWHHTQTPCPVVVVMQPAGQGVCLFLVLIVWFKILLLRLIVADDG